MSRLREDRESVRAISNEMGCMISRDEKIQLGDSANHSFGASEQRRPAAFAEHLRFHMHLNGQSRGHREQEVHLPGKECFNYTVQSGFRLLNKVALTQDCGGQPTIVAGSKKADLWRGAMVSAWSSTSAATSAAAAA